MAKFAFLRGINRLRPIPILGQFQVAGRLMEKGSTDAEDPFSFD